MKTAAGTAFSALSEENARVGLHTLWENTNLFLNVAPFDPSNKATWFEKFYAVAPTKHDSVARCRLSYRRILFELRKFRPAGRSRPAGPGHWQVPEELPPAFDGRLLELPTRGGAAAFGSHDKPRGSGQYGSVPFQSARQYRTHARIGLPAPLLRRADGDEQHARRSRDEVLDQRHPTHARRLGERYGCAVAARYALRLVDRRARQRRLPHGHRCNHGGHRGLAGAYRRRRHRRPRFDRRPLARRRSTAAASSSTPTTRSNWRQASCRR